MRLTRLIQRDQERSEAVRENDDGAEVRSAPQAIPQHVTTEALKRQFEERFAARKRHRGSRQ